MFAGAPSIHRLGSPVKSHPATVGTAGRRKLEHLFHISAHFSTRAVDNSHVRSKRCPAWLCLRCPCAQRAREAPKACGQRMPSLVGVAHAWHNPVTCCSSDMGEASVTGVRWEGCVLGME